MDDQVITYTDPELRELLHLFTFGYKGGAREGGGIKPLAEAIWVNDSALFRWVSPYPNPEPRYFPLDFFPHFVNETGALPAAEHLARKMGRLLVPYPSEKKRGGDLLPFVRQCNETQNTVIAYFDNPTPEAQKKALKALDALLREAASYKVAVQKQPPLQQNLPQGADAE